MDFNSWLMAASSLKVALTCSMLADCCSVEAETSSVEAADSSETALMSWMLCTIRVKRWAWRLIMSVMLLLCCTTFSMTVTISSDPADKAMMFEPTASKIYRHPTFYKVPDDVGNI